MEFTDNVFILFIAAFHLVWLVSVRANASLEIQNGIIGLFSLIFYAAWYPPAALIILAHSHA